jgi:hypothetical protein
MFAMSTDPLSAAPHVTQSRVSGDEPNHAADICTNGVACTGNRNLADFQMLAIDPCGYAQLVWTDDLKTAGVTMHARQTAGTSLRGAGCPLGFDAVKGVTNAAAAPAPARGGRLPATGDGSGPARTLAAGLLAVAALGLGGIGRRRRGGRDRRDQ